MADQFIRNESGEIVIDGVTIQKYAFLSLEPNYTEIENLQFLQYVKGGPRKVVANGKHYTIDGVWDNGERYLSRLQDYVSASSITQIESLNQQNELKNLVDKADNPRIKRKREYPPLEDLVVALWENLIEKKSKKDSYVEQIQKLRKAIKAKYPTENQENAVNKDEEKTD